MLRRARFAILALAALVGSTICGLAPTPAAAQATRTASSARAMSTTADLRDRRIGVLMGSVYDRFAAKTFPQATVMQFDNASDLRQAVLAGKVDAGLGDAEPVREFMRTSSELGILGEPLLRFPIGAGFRKGDDRLRTAFDGFLAGIRADGTYADMVDRWMTKRDTRMPATAPARGGPPLVVGMAVGGFPFAAVQDGALAGFDVELVQRFAASQGRDARITQMPFGSLIASIASGKVDLIAASIFITDERKERIDFSEPYFETPGVAFALTANIASPSTPSSASSVAGAPRLTSLDDLRDKRIGVQLGTVYDIYATKTFPTATVVQFSTYQEMTLAVGAGKVDAGLSDIDTLNEVRRANPDLAPFGRPIFSSTVAAGFRKEDAALRARFNETLKALRADGTYADMVDRWMTRRQTTMPTLPAVQTSGSIAVGVSSGGFPFAAVQDGRLAGFDIELALRFGRAIGKDVRLVDQEFGGLIAALSSGKIDVIVADMFVTAERQQQIDFSDGYFEQDSVAFTRRANLEAHGPPGTSAGAAQAAPGFLARVASSFRSNILVEQRYLLLWDGLKTTVLISILSTLLGTVIGAMVCFMRMSKQRVLQWPARLYIAVLRGTPIVVLLMIIFYVVFASVDIDPVAVAVLAFGMNFGAYTSEMFRSGIESIDRGQTEAGLAMGFTPVQTFTTIVFPQMVQRVLPVYRGEFISLVKMTSVVGYIAVQDLTKASDIIRSRTFDAFFPLIMVAVLYFVVAGVLMQGLEYLERRTDRRRSRRKGVAR